MYTTGQIIESKKSGGFTDIWVQIPGEDYDGLIQRKEMSKVGIWLDDGRLISVDQRKKAYATIRDFADYTGYSPEEAKEVLKALYVERTGEPYFSLSDCSMDTARMFINHMLDICLEHGIILTDEAWERTDDITHMLHSCIRYRKCAVCGRAGEIHHWDAIGMGQDRKHYDDSRNRKVCLCRKHHTLAHAHGREWVIRTYHVYGIIYDEKA